jgi:hypothetical protein
VTVPQDGKRLPDDTPLSDVVLTGRARNVCRYPEPEITTVGQLRKMTDFELICRANCGKMTLLELRLLTGQWQPGKRQQSDVTLKARWVSAVAAGMCECSFEEWKNVPV